MFLDADHSLEAGTQDWRDYSPMVRSGGLFVAHDVEPNPDPRFGFDRVWEDIKATGVPTIEIVAREQRIECGARLLLNSRVVAVACDIAAAELLLPRRFFAADLREADPGLAGVEDLAAAYEASLEATALRAVDLAPTRTMLIVLRVGHKPSEWGREEECEPKLRLSWAHAQGRWPYMPRHKSADDGSAFMRAYEGEVVDEVGTLDAWGVTDGERVMISARRYGNDGRVLALVRPAPPRRCA